MKMSIKNSCLAFAFFGAFVIHAHAVNFTRVTNSPSPGVIIDAEEPACWFSPIDTYVPPAITLNITDIKKNTQSQITEYYAVGYYTTIWQIKTHIFQAVYNDNDQVTAYEEERTFASTGNTYRISVSDVKYDLFGNVLDGFPVTVSVFNLQDQIEDGIWSGNLSNPYFNQDGRIWDLRFSSDKTTLCKWTFSIGKYDIVSKSVDGDYAIDSGNLINAIYTGTVTEDWSYGTAVPFTLKLLSGTYDFNSKAISGDFHIEFDYYPSIEWTHYYYEGTWTVARYLPKPAFAPKPTQKALNVRTTTQLKWAAGAQTVSHDVYFGTDPNLDPNTTFQGNQTATTFDPGRLETSTTYYWRIDEKNANGTTIGTRWNFTTADSTLTVQKCSIKALNSYAAIEESRLGTISISGFFDATEADFLASNEILVAVDANDLPDPNGLVWAFPINATSFKKGKFNYTNKGASTSALTIDTKTSKMTFSLKNADLTGLTCPMTFSIRIGSYCSQVILDEVMVNGTRIPCPAKLIMGVKNSFSVSKFKVTSGKKPNTDSLTAQGTLTIDQNYDKLSPFVIILGSQTFTVPGGQFPAGKIGIESCKKAVSIEGAVVDAKLDFAKCTYSVTVKNADIDQSGDVNFGIDCFGVNLEGFASVYIK